ncbi:YqaJ domain-containing protein [Aphis craccivora]|uniref:YqaJ domain-containing protein n=1 Tax=Aphis craccivora TaxID=307492 RepID=A0A6G0ZH22_APHCR|nr:YqaJ domain-containing protein [Aphis craccivora]
MRPQTSYKSTVHDILYTSEYRKNTEDFAIKYLKKEIVKEIERCGLFIDNSIPYLAATPGATSIEANAISEGFLCSMEMHGLWTEVQ